MDGKGPNRIARELEKEGIQNWNGKAKWYESSIRKMLSNEKYKGDALLSYANIGEVYVLDSIKEIRNNHVNQSLGWDYYV